MRKGRSVVHKSIEDNYNAVIVANHEALAQVLEQVSELKMYLFEVNYITKMYLFENLFLIVNIIWQNVIYNIFLGTNVNHSSQFYENE